jgi:hypothetical protein
MQTEHIEQCKSDYEQVKLESQNDLVKVEQQANKLGKAYFLNSNERIDKLSKSTNNIMSMAPTAYNSDLSERTKRKHLNTFKPLDRADSLSRTSQTQLKSPTNLPIQLPIELEENINQNANNFECNKTNENIYANCINYDLSMEQYDSLMKQINRKKKINIANHQIYLPPAPTIGYDLTNHAIINYSNYKSSPDSNESQSIAATLIHGSVCNCVNIASCSKDKLNGFIHSSDCNWVQGNNSNSNNSRNLSNSVEFQRMHF